MQGQRQKGFLLMELMLALVLTVLSIFLVSKALGMIAQQVAAINLQLAALLLSSQSEESDRRFMKKIDYEPVMIQGLSVQIENFSGCQWRLITIVDKVTGKTVLSMSDLKVESTAPA